MLLDFCIFDRCDFVINVQTIQDRGLRWILSSEGSLFLVCSRRKSHYGPPRELRIELIVINVAFCIKNSIARMLRSVYLIKEQTQVAPVNLYNCLVMLLSTEKKYRIKNKTREFITMLKRALCSVRCEKTLTENRTLLNWRSSNWQLIYLWYYF